MCHAIPLKRVFLICLLVLLSTGLASIASAGTNVWTSIGPGGFPSTDGESRFLSEGLESLTFGQKFGHLAKILPATSP